MFDISILDQDIYDFPSYYSGGIGVCAYYISMFFSDLIPIISLDFNLDTNTDSQGWKIAGIAMGAVTSIIGLILILLTIFKQARNRPWRYKKQEKTYDFYGDMNDDDDDDDEDAQTMVENFDDNRMGSGTLQAGSPEYGKDVGLSPGLQSPPYGKSREIALSPMPDPTGQYSQTIPDQIIFCPGCNRSHPSSHQCMYSTRLANGFSTAFRPAVHVPHHDTIAIQTEDDTKKPKIPVTHTTIDRTIKYAHTTETQTDVSANPRSNITESIILRRVPIPTAKVVVQQPTTKVMIVKVPNVAGKLVIQPRPGTKD